MKTILDYSPPSIDALATLKGELGYTGAQMADLAGLAASSQWRKYTGGAKPRELGAHILFFMAARLELSDAQIERVLARMRQIGAEFSYGEPQKMLDD